MRLGLVVLLFFLVGNSFGQSGGADLSPRDIGQDSTPYVVHYAFDGLLSDTSYYVKIRLKAPGPIYYGYTYNRITNLWKSQTDPWANHPVVRSNSSGRISGWLFGRNARHSPAAIDDTIQIVLRLAGTSSNIYPTLSPVISILDTRTQAGWLSGHIYQDSSCQTPYQNTIVLALNPAGICIGSFITENNHVDEGYDSLNPGYFKLAGLGLINRLEFRSLNSDTLRGYHLTRGPWLIEPGIVKSIDSLPPDSMPPSVISFEPDTTKSACFNARIEAQFNKPMNASTINDTTFLVRGSVSQTHQGTIVYNPLDYSAVFASNRNFSFGETVSVTLKEWITDTFGIRLDGDRNGTPGPDFRCRFKIRTVTPICEVHKDLDSNYIPDRLNDTLFVTGVVTVPDSILGDKFYLQDATAGVCVYYGSNRLRVNLGDSVFIGGVVGQYNGETELMNPVDFVMAEHGHQLPPPLRLSCREFNRERYEGSLVQLGGVRLDSVLLKGSRNHYLYDTSSVCIMRVHTNTDIPGNLASEDTFSVIGVKGQYDYSSQPDSFYELFPRFKSDFSRLTELLRLPIGEVQTVDSTGYDSKYKGRYVKVTGMVTGPDTVFGPGTTTSFYVQDSNCGINIYGASGNATAERMTDSLGARFEIIGKVAEYNGLTEIANGWMTYLGNDSVPSPFFIPYNHFVTEPMEGTLVSVVGTVFEEPSVSGPGKNFVIKNGYPAIAIRVSNSVFVSLHGVRTGKVLRIKGIASQYDAEPPYDTGYQISIRFTGDISDTSSITYSSEPRIESIAPNPFAPGLGEVARIRISSPQGYCVSVDLYDLSGKRIANLLTDGQAGSQELIWDGRDGCRGRCPTGIYLINLKARSLQGRVSYRRRLVVLEQGFDGKP